MSDELRYRSGVVVDDLGAGECTIRGAIDQGASYWRLWFCVRRDVDDQLDLFSVPVLPGGSYSADAPWGKTWGLVKIEPDAWQVSPSINVLGTREVHPGEHPVESSLWHHTPKIVDVPDGESWQS